MRTPVASSDANTIRVVSARTGLGMETLRAWERRYGFPRPERREGSNRRLYSSADVERLVAIQRALGRGYRVGDVIGKTMPQLEELAGEPRGSQEIAPYARAPVSDLVALLRNNQVALLEAELRRDAVSLGPRRFVTEVAHPFAVSVGRGWEDGELSVAHEHLATECLVTQLRQMLAVYQDIDARPRVLLATLPGEPHTLPLQMVAVYLVATGAKPRLLGGSTPPGEIATSAVTLEVDVVGLTVTPTSDRRQARKDVKSLRRALPKGVPIWLGGGGARDLGLEEDGVYVVTSWEAIDAAVASLRGGPPSGRRA